MAKLVLNAQGSHLFLIHIYATSARLGGHGANPYCVCLPPLPYSDK
jgi:hypothetical protein